MESDLIEAIKEIADYAEESRTKYAHTKEWTEVNGGSCMTQSVPVSLLNRIRELMDEVEPPKRRPTK